MIIFNLERSTWFFKQYKSEDLYGDPVLMGAANAFTDFDSPLKAFMSRLDRYETRYQNFILFSEATTSFEFMRENNPDIYSDFCESLVLCIDLCTRFGALEDAAELLRYQEENNLRSEQPSMRL